MSNMSKTIQTRLIAASRSLAVAALTLGLLAVALPCRAQDAGQDAAAGGGRRYGGGQGGPYAGMQRAAGEVVSVSGANITVKTEDGSTLTIVTTDNTRVMKGGGRMGMGRQGGGESARPAGAADGAGRGTMMTEAKVGDLKPGDGVTAMGNLDAPNKALHAALVMVVDAATVKALKENLGKTYITGRVTAIDLDNAKLTVERPDKVSQTIGLDESTSFRRGRPGRGGAGGINAGGMQPSGAQGAAPADAGESITLADVKVGDQVAGQGELKSGTFVPKQLVVMTPGQGGGRRRNGAEGAPAGAGAGSAPPPPGM
ncbi:Myosin N-terminal SH3-like domain-containing protein [Bryocella elongata]|uniref:Myosin N-terminal SH3-like domain-containing protein n=1 Tax=Bryocella elongata TaxID=863522 RepID=A0A1H6AJU0_9BACT|nr:hypothetical protein [Bryocella elongata]SEG48672.1 Myosin N-terminal SH3-like domain-containing protein [Bryocella elongata]